MHVWNSKWGVFAAVCVSDNIFTQEAGEVKLHFMAFYDLKCAFEWWNKNRL